jgi:hypothetical protein
MELKSSTGVSNQVGRTKCLDGVIWSWHCLNCKSQEWWHWCLRQCLEDVWVLVVRWQLILSDRAEWHIASKYGWTYEIFSHWVLRFWLSYTSVLQYQSLLIQFCLKSAEKVDIWALIQHIKLWLTDLAVLQSAEVYIEQIQVIFVVGLSV